MKILEKGIAIKEKYKNKSFKAVNLLCKDDLVTFYHHVFF